MDEKLFNEPDVVDGLPMPPVNIIKEQEPEDNDLPAKSYIDNAAEMFNLQEIAEDDTRRDISDDDLSDIERDVRKVQLPERPVNEVNDDFSADSMPAPHKKLTPPALPFKSRSFMIAIAVFAVGAILAVCLFILPSHKKRDRMPETTKEIADFYKEAAGRLTKKDEAGYVITSHQKLSDFKLTGVDFVDNILNGLWGALDLTDDDGVESDVHVVGQETAYVQFPHFSLSDYSHIISAECTPVNGNYQIKMVFEEEIDPLVTGFLVQVTDILPYDFIVEYLVDETPQIKEYSDLHLTYRDVTIEAEITPTGEFVFVRHTRPADLDIGSMKIGWFTFRNKHMHFDYSAEYTEFEYQEQ